MAGWWTGKEESCEDTKRSWGYAGLPMEPCLAPNLGLSRLEREEGWARPGCGFSGPLGVRFQLDREFEVTAYPRLPAYNPKYKTPQ